MTTTPTEPVRIRFAAAMSIALILLFLVARDSSGQGVKPKPAPLREQSTNRRQKADPSFLGMTARGVASPKARMASQGRDSRGDAPKKKLLPVTATPRSAQPAAVGIPSATPPQLPAAPGIRRVSLVGSLPRPGEGGIRAGAVIISIDAWTTAGPLPRVWGGFVHGRDGGDANQFEVVLPRLSELKPRLIRFDPFPNPDSVKLASTTPDAGQPSSGLRIDWQYTDRVVDAICRIGAKPMMNLATMPSALSSPIGNPRVPRDSGQWAELIRAIVRRYNVDQKRGIAYWELSNEPDRGDFTLQEWLRLYEVFAKAVTEADPNAKIGGPEAAKGDSTWIQALADDCAANHIPLHFLSWHAYDQQPQEIARDIASVRKRLGKYPRLKDIDVVIGEWNLRSARSPENDGLPAAAHVLAIAEALIGSGPVQTLFGEIKDGLDYRDPSARFTGRWGLLAQDNTPKAAYNAFWMLSRLADTRIPVLSPDSSIHVIASRGDRSITALIWNYSAVAGTPDPMDTTVMVRIRKPPWSQASEGVLWQLDSVHGNAVVNPAAAAPARASFRAGAGDIEIPVVLPPMSAVLVELNPAPPTAIDVTAESPQYVVYKAATFPLTATVHNSGSAPAKVECRLSCSDPILIPTGLGQTEPATLAPGESRTYRFLLRAPVNRPDSAEFFQVESGSGSAAIAVKFVSPIQARIEPIRVDLPRPGQGAGGAESVARFKVRLDNRSESPLRARVDYGKTSRVATLQARSPSTVPISISAPEPTPGNYATPVTIMLNGQPVTTLSAAIGVPVLCRYASRKPRINGELSEWGDAFGISLDSEDRYHGKKWGGPADLSGQVFTMWDEENLYVAAAIIDDVHSNPFAPENLTDGDSIQVALDTRRNARPDAAGYDADDCEIGIADCRAGAVVYRRAGPGGAGVVKTARASVQRTGSRTIYEAAIPWSELGAFRPPAGAILGLSLLVNDSDAGSRGYMEWGGGIAGTVKRPGQFVGLRLVR